MSVARKEDGTAWTVLEMIRWSGTYLEGKGVERGRLDAEHLLATALDTDRMGLYLEFDRPLVEDELSIYRELLRRRARREPLQYILGRAGFRGIDLNVDRRVLIPRPETEELVGHVLAWTTEAGGGADTRIWDIGTGSGAIALSLLDEGGFARVVASDVDPHALEVARANAEDCGVSDRLDLRSGSLFDVVGDDEAFDVLVANLPYVSEGERDTLPEEVRDWEPEGALISGPAGLDVIRQVIDGAPSVLRPGGLIALEIGEGQGAAVVASFEDRGGYSDVRLLSDLARRDRFVLAEVMR